MADRNVMLVLWSFQYTVSVTFCCKYLYQSVQRMQNEGYDAWNEEKAGIPGATHFQYRAAVIL